MDGGQKIMMKFCHALSWHTSGSKQKDSKEQTYQKPQEIWLRKTELDIIFRVRSMSGTGGHHHVIVKIFRALEHVPQKWRMSLACTLAIFLDIEWHCDNVTTEAIAECFLHNVNGRITWMIHILLQNGRITKSWLARRTSITKTADRAGYYRQRQLLLIFNKLLLLLPNTGVSTGVESSPAQPIKYNQHCI